MRTSLRGALLSLTLLLALAAVPTAAGPAPQPGTVPGAGVYPLPTRLVVPGPIEAHAHAFEPWAGGPAAPAGSVEVGATLHDALRRHVLLHLEPAPAEGEPALELEVGQLRSGIVRSGGLWQARIDVVVLARAGGVELHRIALFGEARVGAGEGAVRVAFAQAAVSAAQALAEGFDTAAPIGRWLAGRGLRQPSPPPRPPIATFLDVGAVAVTAEGLLFPVEVHAGAAARWWFARVVASWRQERFGTSFDIYDIPEGVLTVTRLGLDGGVPLRLGEAWELRAGAGVHWQSVEAAVRGASTSLVKSAVAGSLVAGVTWIPAKRFGAFRGRLGLEGRVGLGTGVTFAALGHTFEPVTSALLTVGVERSPAE